jgi:hypothetical protein
MQQQKIMKTIQNGGKENEDDVDAFSDSASCCDWV